MRNATQSAAQERLPLGQCFRWCWPAHQPSEPLPGPARQWYGCSPARTGHGECRGAASSGAVGEPVYDKKVSRPVALFPSTPSTRPGVIFSAPNHHRRQRALRGPRVEKGCGRSLQRECTGRLTLLLKTSVFPPRDSLRSRSVPAAGCTQAHRADRSPNASCNRQTYAGPRTRRRM
jgi:hypothetical protein